MEGPFSIVSKPTFVTKDVFACFRDVQDGHALAPLKTQCLQLLVSFSSVRFIFRLFDFAKCHSNIVFVNQILLKFISFFLSSNISRCVDGIELYSRHPQEVSVFYNISVNIKQSERLKDIGRI